MSIRRRVSRLLIVSAFMLAASAATFAQFPPPAVDARATVTPEWLTPYRDAASRLIGEAVESDAAWQRLAYLSDTFGNRLSGSRNLEAAIRWAVEEMKKDGLENVHTEPVMVPHWVRGRESLEIVGADAAAARHARPRQQRRHAAGRRRRRSCSSSTASRSSTRLRDRVKGRIVLFNVPFTTYGETVRFRDAGPSRAGGARRGRDARPLGRSRPACARRTPARCTTPTASRRFPPRRSRPKTPIACSAWSIAARPCA